MGELIPRGVSHHVCYGETVASISQSEPLPPSDSVLASQRTPAAFSSLLAFAVTLHNDLGAKVPRVINIQEATEGGRAGYGAGCVRGTSPIPPRTPRDQWSFLDSIMFFLRAYQLEGFVSTG